MIKNEVIDNFLSEEDYLNIKLMMLYDWRKFPWFYTPNVADKNDNVNMSVYFVHTFQEKEYDLLSPYLKNLQPILSRLDIQDLWRVKGNLYPNQNIFSEHSLHQDYQQPHQAAIYYINTNNGYTKLDDGTKIDSIANRLLLFDGSKSHCSTNCTNERVRMNINFNYIRRNNV